MHELSVALSLVDEVNGILKRENGVKVLSISLDLGQLSGIEQEPFVYCFPLAAEGTALAGAKLDIREIKALIKCNECGEESHPELPFLICAKCSSLQVKIVDGKDFLIRSLEIE